MTTAVEMAAEVTEVTEELMGRLAEHLLYGPKGQRDRASRWWPVSSEESSCCQKVRPPSRRWPYSNSLQRHCNTNKHRASLFGLPIWVVNAVERKLSSKPNMSIADLALYTQLIISSRGRKKDAKRIKQ